MQMVVYLTIVKNGPTDSIDPKPDLSMFTNKCVVFGLLGLLKTDEPGNETKHLEHPENKI